MFDVIARRDFLAKQGNTFWYCPVTVTKAVQGISEPASTTRVAPPAYLRLPQPHWDRELIRLGKTAEITVWRQPLDQYVKSLWEQVPIQQEQEEQRQWNEKTKELVNDLIIAAVIIALPELLPEIGWLGRVATLGGIATTVATEGVAAAVVEECMGFMIRGGYEMFADISSGIAKKVIVELTKSTIRKEATVELTQIALKETRIAIAEAIMPESHRPAVSALKALERVHYFLMQADPTYPKRYAEYRARLSPRPELHAVTTYSGGW